MAENNQNKTARKGISLPSELSNLIITVLTPPGSTTASRTAGFSNFVSEAVQTRLENIFKKDIMTILEVRKEHPNADFLELSQLLSEVE